MIASSKRYKAFTFLLVLLFLGGCGMSKSRIKREQDATARYKFGIAFLGETPPAYQKAYIEFQTAVELDPKNHDAYYALGHVQFELENYKEAIASFKAALDIDPSYSEAHNYIGRIHAFLGEFDAAIASYEKALKNKKYATPEAPYWNMGLIYMRQEKYDYAVQALKNALRMNPSLVAVHNLLGEVYDKMGETDKAISSYKGAIKVNPNDLNAHYNLACIYKKQGSEALANAEFDKAATLSPQLEEEEDFRKCLNPV
ncbi:MAG: tetratricopeptide repeat protein [Nitrospiria bacterium]